MTKQKFDLSYDEIVIISRKLELGEKVLCKFCNKPLELKIPGSGFHPGIYCINKCIEVLIDMKKNCCCASSKIDKG